MDEGYGRRLTYYLDLLKRRAFLLIALAILVACAGIPVVMSLPPVYLSEGRILVESQQIPSNLVESTITARVQERIQSIEQRLTTRSNLLNLIEELDLFPEFRRKIPEETLVELMRSRIKLSAPFDFGAQPHDTTTSFTVGFEYEEAGVAAKVANHLLNLILQQSIQARKNLASETAQFIEREVDRLEQQRTSIEAQITGYTEQNQDALPTKVEFLLTALENREDNLRELDAQIRESDDEKKYLELELRMKMAAGDDASEDGAQSIGARLEALKSELVQKASIYADTHPEIKRLTHQVQILQDQMNAAMSETAGMAAVDTENLSPDLRLIAEKIDVLDSRHEFLLRQRDDATRNIAALKEIIAKAPEVESVLTALQGQRDAIHRNLNAMAEKLATARLGERLEEDQAVERLEVLERPTIPRTPISPDRPKLLVLTLGLAGMVGIGSAVAAEAFDVKVRGTIRTTFEPALAAVGPPVSLIPFISTSSERRRRRMRLILSVVLSAAVIGLLVTAVHFYLMPIDVLLPKLFDRLISVAERIIF